MQFVFELVAGRPEGEVEKDARKLVEQSDSFEAVLRGWLAQNRRALIGPSVDDGQVTGVGVLLSHEGREIAFASVIYKDLYEAYPEVSPINKELQSVTKKGGAGRQLSDLLQKRRRQADAVLYSDKLCTDIGTLKCAVRFALDYASSGCGEAYFSLETADELPDLLCECSEDEKQGPFITAGFVFRDFETGAGFSEDLTVLTDGHPLFKSAVPV